VARSTPDARFKDPFNEVQGVPAIRRIFEHMFESLHEPRFVVTQRQIVDGAQAFLVWEFRFRFKRFDTVTEQVIRGGSHLVLAPDGRVRAPRLLGRGRRAVRKAAAAIGGLMRWLQARANS
jgi:steroid Delta-isomerase